jgi:hypothetical protein
MRKAIPFVLTVVVSMLCTATLVRAAGSSDGTTLEPSSVAPSDLLGSGLVVNKCNSSPKNATEWTRFAKCMTGNMFKVKKWAKVLDTCFTTFQVADRSNDIYGTDPVDPQTFQKGSGLATADVGEPFRYFVGWKKQAGCPQG